MNFTIEELEIIYDALLMYVEKIDNDPEIASNDNQPLEYQSREQTAQEITAIMSRIRKVILSEES
jgi:hypothetical protein